MELINLMNKLNQASGFNFDLNQFDINMRVNGSTPLMVAVSFLGVEEVRQFLDFGADVNAKSPNGSTPLSIACLDSNKDIIELLLERGADVSGNRCLISACEYPDSDIIKMLLEAGAKIDVVGPLGLTPLIAYIKSYREKDVAILQKLIDGSKSVMKSRFSDRSAFDYYIERKYKLLDEQYLALLRG